MVRFKITNRKNHLPGRRVALFEKANKSDKNT